MMPPLEDAATEATGWRILGRTTVDEFVYGATVSLPLTIEGRIAVKESVIGAGVSEGVSVALVTVTTRVVLVVDRIVIVVVGSSEVEVETCLHGQHKARHSSSLYAKDEPKRRPECPRREIGIKLLETPETRLP
jgi:hypothetical protein